MKRVSGIFLIALLFIQSNLFADHATGADIYFKHIGNLKYEVTAIAYRDCRGNIISSVMGHVFNDSFKINLSLKKLAIIELRSYGCPSVCIPNQTSGFGTEAHVFKDTIDFSAGAYKLFGSSKYPEVYFSLDYCCRNGGITTYSPGMFFVEAMLNLDYARRVNPDIGFNDFKLPIEPILYCNNTFNYSFRTEALYTDDSLSYTLVNPKSDFKTFYKYNNVYPFFIYCGGTSQNCQANTLTNPVQGFSFNPKNGNLFFTPINCMELSSLVCQVNCFRKDSGKNKMVAYKKRDFMAATVMSSLNDLPYILKNQDYKIKARENFCVDIPVLDKAVSGKQSVGDTVLIEILKMPAYGQLSLIDSFSREKTMRYCWQVSDSDYLKKRKSEIFFRAFEKRCNLNKTNAISNTITFTVTAPDSFTNIAVRTYLDKNKNGKKDLNEPFIKAKFFIQNKGQFSVLQTDTGGRYQIKSDYGQFKIGGRENALLYSLQKEISLFAAFDSAYVIEIGYQERNGIKGIAFEDLNSNCVWDAGEKRLPDIEIVLQGAERKTFTEADGSYFIQSSPGPVNLSISNNNPYELACGSAYALIMPADSVLVNIHFPLKKKTNFKDLSVQMPVQTFLRGNQVNSEMITVKNRGLKTVYQAQVKMISSQALSSFSSSSPFIKKADTTIWTLDSVRAGAVATIPFMHAFPKADYAEGYNLCLKLFLEPDSFNGNNYLELCRVLNDSLLDHQYKLSQSPALITEQNKRIQYSLKLKVDQRRFNAALVKDTLDTDVFDINSFRVTDNPQNFKINLIDKVIFGEYSGATDPKQEIGFTYAIDVKKKIDHRFAINNQVLWTLENDTFDIRDSVTHWTASGLKIGLINPSAFCPGNTLSLPLTASYTPAQGNRYKLWISDSSGNFNTAQLLLDTLTFNKQPSLNVKLPRNLLPAKNYRLKAQGSAPLYTSFEEDFLQNIEVYTLPQPTIVSNLKNGLVCQNDTVEFKGRGGLQYLFYFGQFALGNFSQDSTLKYRPVNAGVVSVEVKDQHNCTEKSSELSYGIHPLPQVYLQANPQEICYKNPVLIRVDSAYSFHLFQNSVLWKQGNGNGQFTTDSLLNTGTYKALVTDSFGCRNEKQIQVKVNPLPLKPQIYHNQAYLYSSYLNNNQWYTQTGKIDSATGRNFYPPMNGIYRVEYTDAKGCKNISDPYAFGYYGIPEIGFETVFRLYPNPGSGVFQLENLQSLHANLEIYSMNGQLVHRQEIHQVLETLTLDRLAAGPYLVKITAGGRVYTHYLLIN